MTKLKILLVLPTLSLLDHLFGQQMIRTEPEARRVVLCTETLSRILHLARSLAAQVASGNAIPTPRSENPDTATSSAGAQRTYLTHDIAYIQRRARARPL
jgi:hypothetical protein